MKEKITKNLGMRLLSLALAVIVWVVIINLDDPMDTKKITGIPVKVINEDVILSQGKVYEVLEGSTVDVTVRGKKSVLGSLNKNDFSAVADLSKLWDVKAVEIDVTIVKNVPNSTEIISKGKNHTLKVALENVKEMQFPITTVTKGEVEGGYFLSTLKTKPNLIRVKGAESIVERIDQVRVEVDVTNASEDFNVKVVPKAYDSNGRLLDSEKLTFSSDEITVISTLYPSKTVPVEVKVVGEPLDGYAYSKIEFEPKKIDIAGPEGVLNKIKSIPIEIDITNQFNNIEENVDLSMYLPDGVSLATDSKDIMVKITIEKLVTKEILFGSTEIDLKNVPSHLKFNYDNNRNFTVKLTGLASVLDTLNKVNIGPYLDLNGLSTGEHTLDISFKLPEGVSIIDNPTIAIVLSEITESESPSPTPDNEGGENNIPDTTPDEGAEENPNE